MILILQQVAIEGPGLLSIFLKKQNTQLKIVRMENNQGLPSLEECNGLIILGGPMNVYETKKYPFLSEEEAYLKEALKRKIPVLGICLGAQLLAKALGTRVERASREEIGWDELSLSCEAQNDLLLQGLDKKIKVFQWHQDTFQIPKEGVLLVKGKACKNQAFRVGDCAWGLQFHPEMNKAQIITWLKYYNPAVKKDGIIYNYFHNQDKYLEQAKKICNNFLDVVERYKRKKLNSKKNTKSKR